MKNPQRPPLTNDGFLGLLGTLAGAAIGQSLQPLIEKAQEMAEDPGKKIDDPEAIETDGKESESV